VLKEILKRSILPVVLGLVPGASAADPLDGTREIILLNEMGNQIVLGSVTFSGRGAERGYDLRLDETKFGDYFLSMRPFKCLEGSEKHWCHVPYPYENQRRVTSADLTDLEYDLLFLWKGATEYGINMWNGVYYLLEVQENRIVGTMHEMDMELLSAPPEAGNLRPISEADLHETDAASHWLPRLEIR
jgi:hypothetical protein